MFEASLYWEQNVHRKVNDEQIYLALSFLFAPTARQIVEKGSGTTLVLLPFQKIRETERRGSR